MLGALGAVQLGHGGSGGSRFVPSAGGRSPGARSGFRGCGGAGGVGPRPGEPHRGTHRLQRRLRAAHGKGRAPPPRPRALAVSLFRILLAVAGVLIPSLPTPVPGCSFQDIPPRTLRDPPGSPAGPWGSEPDLLRPPLQTSSSPASQGISFSSQPPLREAEAFFLQPRRTTSRSQRAMFWWQRWFRTVGASRSFRAPLAQQGCPHSVLNQTHN